MAAAASSRGEDVDDNLSAGAEQHELSVEDAIEVVGGARTSAFRAYVARNGTWSIPRDESCCFSLVSERRTIDFYVCSGVGGDEGDDARTATAWRDALRTLLDECDRRRRDSRRDQRRRGRSASPPPSVSARTGKRWDPTLHGESLFEAARSRDLVALRQYFDCGCPIDFMDETTGDTVLLVACRLGLEDVARLALLGYHARNDPHPDYGQTALQVAVSAGHVTICNIILETAAHSGADRVIVNHEDENGEAPMHVAARCGSIEILELLVAHGANLGLIDGRGRTCLHLSAQSGHDSCLTYALDSGADDYLEVFSDDGFTPLHLAVRANKTECVQILLEAGANVSAITDSGQNVYNLASKQERIMRLLLDYDASDGESCNEDSDDGIPKKCTLSPVNPNSSFPGSLISPVKQTRKSSSAGATAPSFGGFNSSRSLNQIALSPILKANRRSSFSGGSASGCISERRSGGGHLGRNHDPVEGDFKHGGETWMVYITEDGYPYFYNVNQNSSTWKDPRLQLPAPRMYALQTRSLQAERPASATFRKKLTAIPQLNRNSTPVRMPTMPDPATALKSDDTAVNLAPVESMHTKPPKLVPARASHSLLKPDGANTQNLHSVGTGAGDADGKTPRPVSLRYSAPTTSAQLPAQMPGPASTISVMLDKADTKKALLAPLKVQSMGADTSTSAKSSPPSLSLITMMEETEEDADPNSIHLSKITSIPKKGSSGSIQSAQRLAPTLVQSRVTPEADIRSELFSQIKMSPSSMTATMDNKEDTDPKGAHESGIAVKSCAAGTSSNAGETRDKPRASAISKYQKMRAVGIPMEAILHKMMQDGVETTEIDLFRQLDEGKQSVKKAETSSAKDQLNLLLQDEAVKNELHGLEISPLPPTCIASKFGKSANFSKEDIAKDVILSKYVKMSNVGVPLSAVVAKMSQDGIENEKINMFNVAFGLKTDDLTSGTSKGRLPKQKPTTMHHGNRRASKAMQKIHWTIVAEEKLQNSLWASNKCIDIKDSDIETLESLFSASPQNKSVSGQFKAVAKTQTHEQTSLINPKRANNIAIALAQFRAFPNYDDLCQAVATLNHDNLNIENLANMQLLLPTPEELSNLKLFNGHIEGLGRAELFFLSVMKVPRFPQKLAAFACFLQFDEQARSLSSSLELLARACSEIIESEKLANILRRLLAIGNIMNESTGKSQAKGITLDSLIKTATTTKRGSDDKTTVLDLLVSTVMNSDQKSILVDFRLDFPCVRDAMRLDLEDCRLLLREIQNGAESVDRLIQAEKSQVDSPSDSSTDAYLAKLIPFALHAAVELHLIKNLFSAAEEKVRSLCSFFAEDSQSCKASTIFGVLLEFSRLVEKSKECIVRKVEVTERGLSKSWLAEVNEA
ncbi:hypothetical protein ACHAW5_005104 [Stephanodiscus triporus]|uniref:Formin-like protein n=1 Tax=Stephanodiscus triporus TaxID=2934178 RepID=A0ABD3MIX9_9STRA